MDIETKIKLLLGEKDIQIVMLSSKLEEALNKIKELEKNEDRQDKV